MHNLVQNVTNILGEKGNTWIASLPDTVRLLADLGQLSDLAPSDNMSFHYVAKAMRNAKQPVVLKIGFTATTYLAEKHALMYFDGKASIKLLDYNNQYNALLLEQAIPGTSLKALYPANDKLVINCYVDVVQKLHNKPLSNEHGARHISDWLRTLDNFKSDQLPKSLLQEAVYLKNMLLNSLRKAVFLHGDLHHDNVLKNGDSWLAIDPKGIIGEPEFEVAAFDFIHRTELASNLEIKKLFMSRVETLAKKANLCAKRIRDWVLIRLVLSAVWHIEDNGDPGFTIKLAQMLTNYEPKYYHGKR